MLDIELSIANYRCFGDEPSRIRISDGFTALVGTNNSGKSSLLRFFYEFRNMFQFMGTSPQNSNAQNFLMGKTIHSNSWQRLAIPTGQRIFRTNSDRPISIDIRVNDGPGGPFSIGGVDLVFSITYDRKGDLSSELKDLNGNLVTYKETAPQALAAGMSPLALVASELSQAMYIGPFRNAINIGTLDNYYDIQIGESFIRTFADYKSGANPEWNELIYHLIQEIKRIFGYDSLDINPAENFQVLQLIVDGLSYRLGEQGAGLAHFIVVLANALIRRPSLLLVDEPELNLHASLQLDFLETLAKSTKHGVVFATHSLGLARTAADRIYSLAKTIDGSSKVRPYEDSREFVTLLGQLSFSKSPDLGFSKVLLVEGKSEIRTLMQFLRYYRKEHEVLMIPLHGDAMIKDDVQHELSELLRLSKDVKYLIDSERTNKSSPLAKNRLEFVKLCETLGIDGHVLERRALENYFTQEALSRAFGPSAHALTPYEKKGPQQAWPKTQNWKAAVEMKVGDLHGTDLGKFLEEL